MNFFRDYRFRKRIGQLIKAVQDKNLSYLEQEQLRRLSEIVVSLEKHKVEGLFVEAGCALGGSAIVIGASKAKERAFNVYDVFGTIPPPGNQDGEDVAERYRTITDGQSQGIGGDLYYGYINDLYNVVIGNFKSFDLDPLANTIQLIKGLYQDTMLIKEDVAFVHIDCDWYDSVMTCLNAIVPALVKGGIIVVDDYQAWSGCRKAVDEYFAPIKDQYSFDFRYRLEISKL